MDRVSMCNRIGNKYHISNIEGGEFSYVKGAGSKEKLAKALGHPVSDHYKLDIRFEDKSSQVVVLIETKQNYVDSDQNQLADYLEEEKAIFHTKKIICILANTTNDKIKVWKTNIDDKNILKEEKVLDKMEHYIQLFEEEKQNNKMLVLQNTYALNETLNGKGIEADIRSQFVGTVLLHIKRKITDWGLSVDNSVNQMESYIKLLSSDGIRGEIKNTLNDLLDGSYNKEKKIKLLQQNVLGDQHVRELSIKDWEHIFSDILTGIYKYININSTEGQDILNMFFIAFNKYAGRKNKNQAFTPDHITEFMCRVVDVDYNKRVLDPTCGSGSFLVQAMVKELADIRNQKWISEKKNKWEETVMREHIYGIEVEEKAYGLATTNMLIHADGNSNIMLDSCFNLKKFIIQSCPDIILMNPPYNALPKDIPNHYKKGWTKKNSDKTKGEPTKGMVFIHYLSDVIKEMNKKLEIEFEKGKGKGAKHVKLAVLLPLQCAIGTSEALQNEKDAMLEDNTLDAVFSLPKEIFYPGASAIVCCMVFTLGQPHYRADGTPRSTFFGYCRDDGFIKKKNLGRIETADWKHIEEEWLKLYRERIIEDGKSAIKSVTSKDEWLCEAYMKTDYTKLSSNDFREIINNYVSYLVKKGQVFEDDTK